MELNCRRLGAGYVHARVVVTMLLLFAGIGVLLRLDADAKRPQAGEPLASTDSANRTTQPNLRQIRMAYGHSPLMFEPNVGQTDSAVKFMARGSDYLLFLTQNGALLALQSSPRRGQSSIQMGLLGARSSTEVSGYDKLDSVSNYFIGNRPSHWHSNVPHYARVRYRAVYPGIDLTYYGRQGQLEYDFEVAPGADPKQVALQFGGADSITLDSNGDLILVNAGGTVKLQAPRVYQRYGEKQKKVAAKFAFRGNQPGKNQVGFELGDYDPTRELVIDPLLTYSTYLGGSGQESCSAITGNTVMPGLPGTPPPVIPGTAGCPSIAADIGGNIYIAGSTSSADFPPQPGAIGNLHGTANVFVSEFNSTGSAILSTYLGGTDASEIDYTSGITVDSGLNVIVAGTTNSSTFPTSGAPFQASPGTSGTYHAFVTKFAQGGVGSATPLKYSTYLYGNGIDLTSGVAVDTLGNIYVIGTTTSTNFPVTPTALAFTSPGSPEFFFAKLNPALNGAPGLLYSTYIGGTTTPAGSSPVATGGGIAVDSNCNAYVTGGTNYTNMPVLNAYKATSNQFNGGVDAWLGEFAIPVGASCSSPNASNYVQNYLTYFGGTGVDIAYGIAVDSAFHAYIVGGTNSSDMPAGSIVGLQSVMGCPQTVANNTCPVPEAFVAKFNQPVTTGTTPGLVTLGYSSYLGGVSTPDNGLTVGLAIAVDSTSGALITGLTSSTDFNILGAGTTVFQTTYGGGAYDAFFARIDTSTGACVVNTVCPSYTSYLGGSGTDIGTGIALDSRQNVYMAGETSSSDFHLANPFQSTLNGTNDAFLTKLGPAVNLPTTMAKAPNPNPVGIGNPITFTYTVTNAGDQTNGVVFTDYLASASTATATATPGGTCPAAQNGGATLTCSLGTLTSGQTATVSVTVTPNSTFVGSVSNSGGVTQPALENTFTQPTVTVNDYTVTALGSSSQTVPAGVPAIYTLQVTPTGPIPEAVNLACGTLPTGATCSWANSNTIPSLNNGATTRTLEIVTIARVTTTARLWQRGGGLYATLLPISGLALLGVGASRKKLRKRYWLSVVALSLFFGLVGLESGCGGSSKTTTTTGTPAGTYTVVVNASSGSTTRSTAIQLVVQ